MAEERRGNRAGSDQEQQAWMAAGHLGSRAESAREWAWGPPCWWRSRQQEWRRGQVGVLESISFTFVM